MRMKDYLCFFTVLFFVWPVSFCCYCCCADTRPGITEVRLFTKATHFPPRLLLIHTQPPFARIFFFHSYYYVLNFCCCPKREKDSMSSLEPWMSSTLCTSQLWASLLTSAFLLFSRAFIISVHLRPFRTGIICNYTNSQPEMHGDAFSFFLFFILLLLGFYFQRFVVVVVEVTAVVNFV